MSETKFTSAPWKWRVLRTGTKQYVHVDNGAGNCGQGICTIDLTYKHNTDTAKANANLITTAPELYEVTEMLASQLDAIAQGFDYPREVLIDKVEKAQKLLAKARGEQNVIG